MAKTVVENKEQVLVGEGRDFERIRRISALALETRADILHDLGLEPVR